MKETEVLFRGDNTIMCVEFSGFKLTAALFKELIEVQKNLYSGFKCKTLQGTQSKSYYYLIIDKLMLSKLSVILIFLIYM